MRGFSWINCCDRTRRRAAFLAVVRWELSPAYGVFSVAGEAVSPVVNLVSIFLIVHTDADTLGVAADRCDSCTK